MGWKISLNDIMLGYKATVSKILLSTIIGLMSAPAINASDLEAGIRNTYATRLEKPCEITYGQVCIDLDNQKRDKATQRLDLILDTLSEQYHKDILLHQKISSGNYQKDDAEKLLNMMDNILRSGICRFQGEAYDSVINKIMDENDPVKRQGDKVFLSAGGDEGWPVKIIGFDHANQEVMIGELKKTGNLGMDYSNNTRFFTDELISKKMACFGFSLIYKSFAQREKLPMDLVITPSTEWIRHMFVRMTIPGDSPLDYDPSIGKVRVYNPEMPSMTGKDLLTRILLWKAGEEFDYNSQRSVHNCIHNYRTIRDFNPDSAEVYEGLGALQDNDFFELLYFRKSLELDPDNIAVHSKMASVLYRTGLTESESDEYDRIIELAPNDATGYIGKARLLVENNMPEEALTYCDLALRIDPANIHVLSYQGQANMDLERYSEAKDAYDKILDIEPDNIGASYKMAYCEYLLSNYEKSAMLIDQLIDREFSLLFFDTPQISDIFEEMTHSEKAITDNLSLFMNLKGMIYYENGSYEKAVSAFEFAYELHPKKYLEENIEYCMEKIRNAP